MHTVKWDKKLVDRYIKVCEDYSYKKTYDFLGDNFEQREQMKLIEKTFDIAPTLPAHLRNELEPSKREWIDKYKMPRSMNYFEKHFS